MLTANVCSIQIDHLPPANERVHVLFPSQSPPLYSHDKEVKGPQVLLTSA